MNNTRYWLSLYDKCYTTLIKSGPLSQGIIKPYLKFYNTLLTSQFNLNELIIAKDVFCKNNQTSLTLCKKDNDYTALMLSRLIENGLVTTGLYNDNLIIYGSYAISNKLIISEEDLLKLLTSDTEVKEYFDNERNKLKNKKRINTIDCLNTVTKITEKLISTKKIKEVKEGIVTLYLGPINEVELNNEMFNPRETEIILELRNILK